MNARRTDEMMIASQMRMIALFEKWKARHFGDRLARMQDEGLNMEGEDGVSEIDQEQGEEPDLAGDSEDTETEPEAGE